ncbi:membrane protein [Streptomyces phage Miek]|jgi:hypothetical protein|nr:membrane protein [Streptomyces phage Miek]
MSAEWIEVGRGFLIFLCGAAVASGLWGIRGR